MDIKADQDRDRDRARRRAAVDPALELNQMELSPASEELVEQALRSVQQFQLGRLLRRIA